MTATNLIFVTADDVLSDMLPQTNKYVRLYHQQVPGQPLYCSVGDDENNSSINRLNHKTLMRYDSEPPATHSKHHNHTITD